MTISGFSFVRNGVKLYYPIIESIKSILPICDEFVIAVGKGDEDDTTRELIAAINDTKIKIIDTEWDEKYFKKGIINSIQTDIAMRACLGDWLFYVQADEVVHEKYLTEIQKRCHDLLGCPNVEGLVFKYKHFWGDYDHYQNGHGWYPNEIRIVRNIPNIHSYQSAQSFRWFDFYDNPRQETGTRKLNVAEVDAEIFHYGWVRPPHLMQNKRKSLDSVHWGIKRATDYYQRERDYFDYGPLNLLAEYKGTHPQVMQEMITSLNWKYKLQFTGKADKTRLPHKHEKIKYRLLSWFEKSFNRGKQIGEFKNYNLLKNI
jgi:glycosyltransferase involved in cell wall biosynthesis